MEKEVRKQVDTAIAKAKVRIAARYVLQLFHSFGLIVLMSAWHNSISAGKSNA